MRRLGLGVSALAVLAALAGYAWLRDEPLDAEVGVWLEDVPAGAGSEAYLLLMGLDAPPDAGPTDWGARRLAAYQAWLGEPAPRSATFRLEPPERALEDDPVFCDIDQPACFQRLRGEGATRAASLQAQRPLLERYQALLALDDYRTLSAVSLDEPMVRIRHFMRGQQLLGLRVLQLAEAGQGSAAAEALRGERDGLRRHLARADNLVLKLALARMLGRNLQWQALLQRDGLVAPGPALAPLSEAERSMQAPLRREFLHGARGLQQLSEERHASLWERLLMWVGYKPNMTVNASLPPYRQAAALSRLEPGAFAEALQRRRPDGPRQTDPRNPVGNLLLGIALPDFVAYAGRVQDLDSRIHLLNLLSRRPHPAEGANLEYEAESHNPYFPQRTARFEEGRVCFDGPLPDERGMRCLPR